jgi:ATP-dependent helicase Lhr and Lhr-like helicase
VLRYARTNLPFTADECAARYGLGRGMVEAVLKRLSASGRVVRGAFRPGGTHHEWCESGVLRTVRQRSLARLRQEVEPVDAEALGRLVVAWHGVARPRAGLDALLDAVEQLQGAPLAASVLERDVLPARVEGYRPADLDLLVAAGEVVWVGVEPLGDRDGRVALYLADHLQALLPPPLPAAPAPTDLGSRIVAHLEAAGASFFPAIHAACGGGFPQEVVDALWDLVWQGLVTNDALHALRAFVAPPARTRRERHRHGFRSRRVAPPAAQGRWALVAERRGPPPAATAWATAMARQLLARHGVLTRESVGIEALRGGFSAIYDVLKAMEEAGRIRRGFFVGGLGAAQFAQPAALDLLRSLRDEPSAPQTVHLAATDPANPYGALIAWPRVGDVREARGPTRTAGATVILVNGWLAAYLARGGRTLSVYLPEAEPTRSLVARETASRLHHVATVAGGEGMLIADIDGVPIGEHALLPYLLAAGFVRGAMGVRAAPPREAARGRGSQSTEEHAPASVRQAARSVSRA